MVRFVINRLLLLIPIILVLTFVVFLILYLTPGDPTLIILGNEFTPELSAKLKAELGLDRPFFVQYLSYIWGLFHGDFGLSYITRAPINEQIAARFPNTAAIVFGAMSIAVLIGLPIGIYTGTKPYTTASNLATVISLLGVSLPVFWLSLLLILLFSVKLKWLPSSGLDSFSGIILPSIAVGFNYTANIMRTTRSSILEAVRQDYVRTAKAKGVSYRNVISNHVLKNAMMPTVTVIGLNVGSLLGGVVVSETVFSIPGTGRLLVESIYKRDTPGVLGCLVVMAITVAVSSLAVDLIYAFIDPRIRAQYSGKGVK